MAGHSVSKSTWSGGAKGAVVIYYLSKDNELAFERARRRSGARAADYPFRPDDELPIPVLPPPEEMLNNDENEHWRKLIDDGLQQLEDVMRRKCEELRQLEESIDEKESLLESLSDKVDDTSTNSVKDSVIDYVMVHPGCRVREIHDAVCMDTSMTSLRKLLKMLFDIGTLRREMCHDDVSVTGYFKYWRSSAKEEGEIHVARKALKRYCPVCNGEILAEHSYRTVNGRRAHSNCVEHPPTSTPEPPVESSDDDHPLNKIERDVREYEEELILEKERKKNRAVVPSDGRAATWRSYYESGDTLEEISRRCGSSAGSVRRVLVSAGVEMRPPGCRRGKHAH